MTELWRLELCRLVSLPGDVVIGSWSLTHKYKSYGHLRNSVKLRAVECCFHYMAWAEDRRNLCWILFSEGEEPKFRLAAFLMCVCVCVKVYDLDAFSMSESCSPVVTFLVVLAWCRTRKKNLCQFIGCCFPLLSQSQAQIQKPQLCLISPVNTW